MNKTVNRRKFLNKSFGLCAASAVAASGSKLVAQSVVRRPERFEENTLITERKPFTWPGGKTLAVWIIPNVEVFVLNPPGGPCTSKEIRTFWASRGENTGCA